MEPRPSKLPPDDSPRERRTFSQLHRDVWQVVRQAPAVFVLLPMIVWFPVDVLIESVVGSSEDDWWWQLYLSIRLTRIAQYALGTLVAAVFLSALIEIGGGRRVRLGTALRGGLAMWGRIFGVAFAAGWRIALGTLLLVVPGVYLALRYALAAPVAAFEGKRGKDALDASAASMRGGYWRLFFWFVLAGLVYAGLALAPDVVTPAEAPPWRAALGFVGYEVLGSWFLIGLTLVYADGRPENSLVAPVGREETARALAPGAPPTSGRLGVACAVTASLVAFVAAAFLSLLFEAWAAVEGDVARDLGAHEEALEHYRRAARWDPENAETQASIGRTLRVVGRLAEAEPYLARAAELEPQHPVYRAELDAVLRELGREGQIAWVPAPTQPEDEQLNPRLLIDGGKFLMGSPEGVDSTFGGETPQHLVTLSPFVIQKHEVTNREYRRFKPDHEPDAPADHPVANVSWDEARAYAQWLGGDLPTEAQWEFTARGKEGRTYPWGEEEPDCSRANYRDCGGELKPVNMRPAGATPEGVEDLAGNVWEWCRDWKGEYSAEEQQDPLGPQVGSRRVKRGGSSPVAPILLRGASRYGYYPEERHPDVGFRVVWPGPQGHKPH